MVVIGLNINKKFENDPSSNHLDHYSGKVIPAHQENMILMEHQKEQLKDKECSHENISI